MFDVAPWEGVSRLSGLRREALNVEGQTGGSREKIKVMIHETGVSRTQIGSSPAELRFRDVKKLEKQYEQRAVRRN